MCGIFGIYSKSYKTEERHRFCKIAINSMDTRGPDGSGFYNSNNISFAQNRLAIIDTFGGKQPMVSLNKRYTIVFNGEIINFKSIRKKLSAFGYTFNSDSDTEVLLVSYQHYGEKCVDHLNGMYSFAIYDNENDYIFIARDPLGIKPFYYSLNNTFFAFSSEVRSFYKTKLLRFEPTAKYFDEFLIFGNITGEETLHNGIKELLPGHFGIFKEGHLITTKFWSPFIGELDQSITLDKCITKLEYEMNRIGEEWSLSDKGIGISGLLSGGLDSTIITSLMSKFTSDINLYTFYNELEKESDERSLAKKVASQLSANHQIIKLNPSKLSDDLISISDRYGDPLNDSNSITFYNLCKQIRETSNSKVVISGEGSDEIFGGYKRHRLISESLLVNKNHDIAMGLNSVALGRLKLFTDEPNYLKSKRFFIASELESKSKLGKVLEFDQKCFMPPYIQRLDQLGMMFSLEFRPPFLDHKLVNLANAIPSKFKLHKDLDDHIWSKYILRNFGQNIIPKDVCWNKKNFQFSYPAGKAFDLNGEFNNLLRGLCDSSSFLSRFYSIEGIKKLLDQHNSSFVESNHSNTLFRILSLELWGRSTQKLN